MIKLRNLIKKFGREVVLDYIDLEVAQGDRIALIGQNGAGKTTLIRVILGQYVHQGDVMVMGKDPRKNRVDILEDIGFVPQIPPPIQMSVKELIDFSARISRKSSQEKIRNKALDLGLELEDHAHKTFLKLSGGMKQKLLIALALAKEPKILMMDEPAANLDPQGRQAFFLQLLGSLKGTSMILSSHRVDEVLNLINRIVEMDYGKIVRDEKIEQSNLTAETLSCEITLMAPDSGAAKMLDEWNFESLNGGVAFQGHLIGADRLRFLTALSHYANHIEKLKLN